MRGNRKGFTLIELLVVIAIIAILAAILFPLFTRAKNNAKITTCQSNEHQIFTALSLYAESYDGRVPDCWQINNYRQRQKPSDLPDPGQVFVLLQKYAGNKKDIFKCPADVITPPINASGNYAWGGDWGWKCTYVAWGSSYQWNLRTNSSLDGKPNNGLAGLVLGPQPATDKDPNPTPPSRTPVLRDGLAWHYNNRGIDSKDRLDPKSASNVLFVDGHVKFAHGTEYHGF